MTDTIKVTIPDTLGAKISLVTTGPRGPMGPDPWLDPVQQLTASGALEIDYSLGKHIELSLDGNSQITVANWPAAGRLARLTIDITSSGLFTITSWPAGVIWQNGNPPEITQAGKDTIILTTTSGGAEVRGYIAGANFV